MLKAAINRLRAAVSGGGSKLPPVPPPKLKPKQQAYPDYVTTTRPQTSAVPKVDPQLASTDIVETYRLGRTTQEVIRNLARANPDLSAAVSAYLRVGIPERYIALARDPDGTVNDDATRFVFEILQRFDKLPAYDAGFSQTDSVRSVSEALAKELILYGGAGLELVLDKARMPYKFQPVSVTRLKFYPDEANGIKGLRPVQEVGGVEIDLDIATFFMVYLDASLLDAYPQSPLESAIQPVLLSAQFLNDLRRVLVRHVYPRYDVSIDEEKLRKVIPPETLHDENKLTTFLNDRIAEVESAINGLEPEEAVIHFDWVTVQYLKNDDGQGTADKFEVVKNIVDANLAKGAKTLPAVLGNGSGSQNVASTETMLFTLGANSMVRLKLQELYSKALTLGCRAVGLEVIVEFEFDEIELRPRSELAAFYTMRAEKLKWEWSCGLIGDMEASLRLTGKPVPKGFTTLAGTNFIPLGGVGTGADTEGNAYSGSPSGGGQSGGGADKQSRGSKTPEKSKGPAK